MKPRHDTIRAQFPIIAHLDRLKKVYLDSASTSQKPRRVLDEITNYYATHNANPRRGVSRMSHHVSEMVENSRARVASFIQARAASEVVFTKNTTESLNLVAFGFGLNHITKDDEIVLSRLEHHSNLVPWQEIAQRTGAVLRYIDADAHGQLDMKQYASLLTPKTKIVAITHVSNVFGSITPLAEMITLAHLARAVVIVDGAQAVPHFPVQVTDLDADFYAFSGHKMYAPNGVGVLYGKRPLLAVMQPLFYGGGMITEVGDHSSSYEDPPYRFEGGTADVAAIIGLSSAIDVMESIGFATIQAHENELLQYARDKIRLIKGLEVYWPESITDHTAVLSCNLRGVHPHDTASVLDELGLVVRAGHHCAMPLMRYLGLPGTVRLSLGVYNTHADIDLACAALEQARVRFK